MFALIENIVQELTHAGIVRKQKTITNLFPTFHDRVKKIAGMGGLRLVSMKPELWTFKVHSGTQDDVWYDNYVKFVDIEDVIKKNVKDRRLWNKNKTHVLLPKLANKVLFKCQVQVKCSCPAFQYWGPAHILSRPKRNAKYTDPENRPPRIRNPRQYGAVCKHAQNILNVLPWYTSTMAKYLKEYYGDDIIQYEQEIEAEHAKYKKVGKELSKK